MNEGTDKGDPDLLTSAEREQAQRAGGFVDSLKIRERTLLKETRMNNDREDTCSTGFGCVKQIWQFERGNERGGEEVCTILDQRLGGLPHS